MVNHYETVFILTPVLSDYQIKETVDYFRKIITDNGGEIVHEEFWGMKTLAYPIQKKTTGYYQLFEFKASGDLIEKLELEYRRSEKILRFLTVKLDKYGIEYNERRRKKIQEKQQNETKN